MLLELLVLPCGLREHAVSKNTGNKNSQRFHESDIIRTHLLYMKILAIESSCDERLQP